MDFVQSVPPTVLLYPGAPKLATAQNVVTINFGLTDGTHGVLFPLFIGSEPAERFVTSVGNRAQGMTPFSLESFDALDALLVDLKKSGVTHVNFNADPDKPNPIPIDEVIASLRNRIKG